MECLALTLIECRCRYCTIGPSAARNSDLYFPYTTYIATILDDVCPAPKFSLSVEQMVYLLSRFLL